MNYQELSVEAGKASPPTAVSGLLIFGVPLSDVVVVLTGVYTLFLLFFLLRDKWWRERK